MPTRPGLRRGSRPRPWPGWPDSPLQPGGASSVRAAWAKGPPARSPLPTDLQLLPLAALPRRPAALSGGVTKRPDPAGHGPRPEPILRRLRSVAPGPGPAATARPGRTRRCESRARTTVPTGLRGAARQKARGGAGYARQSGVVVLGGGAASAASTSALQTRAYFLGLSIHHRHWRWLSPGHRGALRAEFIAE